MVKVEENHKMLHTLWIDFINRKTIDGNLAGFNEPTNNKKAPGKRKWSAKRKRKSIVPDLVDFLRKHIVPLKKGRGSKR